VISILIKIIVIIILVQIVQAQYWPSKNRMGNHWYRPSSNIYKGQTEIHKTFPLF